MKATLVLLVALATLCTLALLSDGLAIDEEARQRQRPQEARQRYRVPQRQRQQQQQHHQQGNGNRRRGSTRAPGQLHHAGKMQRPAPRRMRTRRPNARRTTPKP